MESEYAYSYVLTDVADSDIDTEPGARVAQSGSTFAVEKAAIQRLIIEMDQTAPPELDSDDDFEARLCEFVCKQAEKYELPDQQRQLIEKIGDKLTGVTKDTIPALFALLHHQERDASLSGSESAYTEMLTGICCDRLRLTEQAVKSLRNALTRFQQFGDDSECPVMIESLCRLSEIYRCSNKKESARSCMKQAFRLLTFAKRNWRSYYRVLAEMAQVTAAVCNYEAAIAAYKQLLKAKFDAGRRHECSTIDILIGLASVFHTVHQLEDAEQALIGAGVLYHELGEPNQRQFVELVQKLAGVLFQLGQFKQSELLNERANQIIGRAGNAPSHVLLGDILSQAACYRECGNHAEAKRLYRAALVGLESRSEGRTIERLPVLAGIFLLTTDEQELQRESLMADMEVSLSQFFCQLTLPIHEGILRVAWIYSFLGYSSAANDLRLTADRICQSQRRASQSDSIFPISTELRVLPHAKMARLCINS